MQVDPVTIEAMPIYKLLNNANKAFEASETPEIEEKMAKIPIELHQKLHIIHQWGPF